MTADYEEFLTPEEIEEQDDAAPAAGNIDPTFKDQHSEGARIFFDGAFDYTVANGRYTPLARAMWKRFSELHDCNPSTILFVIAEEGKAMYRDKPKFVDVAVLGGRWQEILKQVTGLTFTHVITIYQGNVDKYEQSYEQMLVHLYNALRQIKSDGTLRGYDIHAFTEVYANLKAGWDKEGCSIPNLIDTGDWIGMRQLQGNLFEDRSGENAAAKDF